MITEARPRPGRPRSAHAHQAILQAAVDLLMEAGFAGMSMEQIAHRARVGKATIYRRWPSKEDLVIEAVRHLRPLPPVVDTGDARRDLLAALLAAQEKASSDTGAQVMARLMSEAARNPDLSAAYRKHLVGPRRRMVAELIERGVARGQIRADVDVELLVDMIAGPFLYRTLISGGRPEFPPGHAERMVEVLFEGIGPRGNA